MADAFAEVARGFYLEALLIDGDDIWYTDVVVGGVKNLRTGQVVLPERIMVGGLLLNDDGSLIVAGMGSIGWVNPQTGKSGVLVEGFDGVNEMRADGRGGLFFGTIDLPAVLRGETPGPSTIYHLSADRRLTALAEGFHFANGLSLSPDGKTFYFNDSFNAVLSFPVGADFALGPERTLLDKPDCDGLALDVDGNLWICGFSSPELLCLDPQGCEVRRLALPGRAATNVRFGGPDMRDIYVTVVDPDCAMALAEGRELTEKSSVLVKSRAPVAGAPMGRSGFKLV